MVGREQCLKGNWEMGSPWESSWDASGEMSVAAVLITQANAKGGSINKDATRKKRPVWNCLAHTYL